MSEREPYHKLGWVEWFDDLSHRYLPRWLAQRLCPWTTPPYRKAQETDPE